jgi:WD40 repeat protein
LAGFSADGKIVWKTGSNNDDRWDGLSGRKRRSLGTHAGVTCASMLPEYKVCLTVNGNGDGRLWDIETGLELRRLMGEARSTYAVLHLPRNRLLSHSRMLIPPLYRISGTPKIWDADTGGLVHQFNEPREHKTGNFLTVVGETIFATSSRDGTRFLTTSTNHSARLYAAAKLGEPIVLAGHEGTVSCGAFSPNGRHAATASDDATVRIWDTDTGSLVRVLTGHEGPVARVEYGRNGRLILTAANDGTARIRDAMTGAAVGLIPFGRAASEPFATFLGNGDRVMTWMQDKARIWSLDALALVKSRRTRDLTDQERAIWD